MSWLGKVLGGGIGFALGGPLGAVLGAAIGHHAVDREGSFFSGIELKQGVFFVATFSMLGKLSKADGQVSKEEIQLVEDVMRDHLHLDANARRLAIEIFNRAKDSNTSFLEYAQQFHAEFSGQREALVSIIDLLLRMAHADGALHPEEERMIADAVRLFDVENEYAQLTARYSGTNTLAQSYAILGAEDGESLPDIKRKYRRLAMQYHPDRIQAQGMTPELADAAEARFKEIQNAFDQLEKHLSR